MQRLSARVSSSVMLFRLHCVAGPVAGELSPNTDWQNENRSYGALHKKQLSAYGSTLLTMRFKLSIFEFGLASCQGVKPLALV